LTRRSGKYAKIQLEHLAQLKEFAAESGFLILNSKLGRGCDNRSIGTLRHQSLTLKRPLAFGALYSTSLTRVQACLTDAIPSFRGIFPVAGLHSRFDKFGHFRKSAIEREGIVG